MNESENEKEKQIRRSALCSRRENDSEGALGSVAEEMTLALVVIELKMKNTEKNRRTEQQEEKWK